VLHRAPVGNRERGSTTVFNGGSDRPHILLELRERTSTSSAPRGLPKTVLERSAWLSRLVHLTFEVRHQSALAVSDQRDETIGGGSPTFPNLDRDSTFDQESVRIRNSRETTAPPVR
jgi:hypothetical protein